MKLTYTSSNYLRTSGQGRASTIHPDEYFNLDGHRDTVWKVVGRAIVNVSGGYKGNPQWLPDWGHVIVTFVPAP